VTTVTKSVDLGTGGALNLPLALSNVSETDSIIRARDGNIVVIGGLMRQASISDRSQVPGAGDVPGVGELFKNSNRQSQKRELVILLKPTVVYGDAEWNNDRQQALSRIQKMQP
jgi:MSHA biogenesis protein MshL